MKVEMKSQAVLACFLFFPLPQKVIVNLIVRVNLRGRGFAHVQGSFTHILHAMFFRPLLIRATIATCHPLKHAELWSIHANPLDVLEGSVQLKV